MDFKTLCLGISRATALSAFSFALVSCGGGGGGSGSPGPVQASGYPSSPVSCDTAGQRAWLRDYMNDKYFWWDRQGTPNEAASSMGAYLSSLLFSPTDRYSFAQSTSSFTAFFVDGRRTGYGYSLTQTGGGGLSVLYVEPLGPARAAGMKRGDAIVSIDGLSPSAIIASGLPSVSTAGVTRSFTVTNPADGTRSFVALSADYALSPVLSSNVFTTGTGRKVGYLAYNEFISGSASAIAAAIDTFRAQGVQDVILDLRYNGGGSVSVAQNLTYLLGGTALSGQVFARYQYSSKQSANNFVQNFPSTSYTTPLANLSRLLVLTSASTASASELVINSLRPYKPVITVGRTTFGKPYAFQPIDACGTTYNAVNLQILNANSQADYASGISANCAAADDLTRALGDPLEGRTAAALSYIQTGSCPPASNLITETKFPGFQTENAALPGINSGQFAMKNEADNSDPPRLDENAKPAATGTWLR